MTVKIHPTWAGELAAEFDSGYFAALADFVRGQYRQETVYPPAAKIFAAFDACPYPDVRVVILGQDPYHGPGQANGLCFSVAGGVPLPPSLVNIFREIKEDTGADPVATGGDLMRWARQGVLMLNATLTVRAHCAGSHQGQGWEKFTDAAVAALNRHPQPLVFMLWGAYAINKGRLIDRSRHLVLTAPHPSPLSAYRGFFGCRHFSAANNFLRDKGRGTIDWG